MNISYFELDFKKQENHRWIWEYFRSRKSLGIHPNIDFRPKWLIWSSKLKIKIHGIHLIVRGYRNIGFI